MFRCDVDDESVDITVGLTGGEGTVRSPRLDIQLKCTEQDFLRTDGVHFPLQRKNDDDLRAVDFMVPKVLVVLMVPDDLAAGVAPTPEERLCLHRFAWRMNLAGADERSDVDTPTVVLPRGPAMGSRYACSLCTPPISAWGKNPFRSPLTPATCS